MSINQHESTAIGSATFAIEGFKGREMPVTIGIKATDDLMMPLIKRGTRLPASFSQVFTTSESFQMSFYAEVLLGERPFASDNMRLCDLRNDEGSFRSAGKPRYELTVTVNGTGQIGVRIRNLELSGKQNSRISYSSSSISSDAIREIEQDALLNKEPDTIQMNRYNSLAQAREDWLFAHEEYWPIAKRKMSLLEKKHYKQCRSHIREIISDGPVCFDDEKAIRLNTLLDELKSWTDLMAERSEAVMSWYGKRPRGTADNGI